MYFSGIIKQGIFTICSHFNFLLEAKHFADFFSWLADFLVLFASILYAVYIKCPRTLQMLPSLATILLPCCKMVLFYSVQCNFLQCIMSKSRQNNAQTIQTFYNQYKIFSQVEKGKMEFKEICKVSWENIE